MLTIMYAVYIYVLRLMNIIFDMNVLLNKHIFIIAGWLFKVTPILHFKNHPMNLITPQVNIQT